MEHAARRAVEATATKAVLGVAEDDVGPGLCEKVGPASDSTNRCFKLLPSGCTEEAVGNDCGQALELIGVRRREEAIRVLRSHETSVEGRADSWVVGIKLLKARNERRRERASRWTSEEGKNSPGEASIVGDVG